MKKETPLPVPDLKNETILRLKRAFTLSAYANAIIGLIAGLMAAGGNGLNALIVCLILVIINLIIPSFVIQKLHLSEEKKLGIGTK